MPSAREQAGSGLDGHLARATSGVCKQAAWSQLWGVGGTCRQLPPHFQQHHHVNASQARAFAHARARDRHMTHQPRDVTAGCHNHHRAATTMFLPHMRCCSRPHRVCCLVARALNVTDASTPPPMTACFPLDHSFAIEGEQASIGTALPHHLQKSPRAVLLCHLKLAEPPRSAAHLPPRSNFILLYSSWNSLSIDLPYQAILVKFLSR